MSERRQRGPSNDPDEGPGAETPGPEESPPAEDEEEKDGPRPGRRPGKLGEEGHVPEGEEGRSPPDRGTYTDGGSRKKSR